MPSKVHTHNKVLFEQNVYKQQEIRDYPKMVVHSFF